MKRTLLLRTALMLLMAVLSLNAFSQKPPQDGEWVDGSFRFCEPKAEPEPAAIPGVPEQAENLTLSPDGSLAAYTLEGNLWTVRLSDGALTQWTFDGSETVYNGWASWVYFEEIFGRPSKYRAFWWSPDGSKLAFYRFDDTLVPMFPIYSPFGQDGSLRRTHYPKAGERNPEVTIGFIDLVSGADIVWADFDPAEDQYFGTPFWRDDSSVLYVPWEPRIQNTLELYAVNPADGSKASIYREQVATWLDWPADMLFTREGLYMVRDFETGWQQIYFLSYDGKKLKRLTGGDNWRISLLRVEPKDGTLYFTAERDSHVRKTLYKLTPKGRIEALTDPALHVQRVLISPDGKQFAAWLSSLTVPTQVWVADTRRGQTGKGAEKVWDGITAPESGLGTVIVMNAEDGFELPGVIYYPKDFDPSKQYPVHVDIYGGPDTPMVYDRWVSPMQYAWFAENGIIELIADCRAAGHNGRAGLDMIYKHLNTIEVEDFKAWARYLRSLPFVKADKIGVEGFSFGGTMTTTLLLTASEYYHYGIAGGGVYDWALYDSHYTERFMSTPQDNPAGYRDSKVLGKVSSYPVPPYEADGSVMLKITHGTGDDNVHFQNTLQLIDALQRAGKGFELMIYPDGMHGYRGVQGMHSTLSDWAFWQKYLLDK